MADRLDELIEYAGRHDIALLAWAVGEISGLREAKATLAEAFDRSAELRERDRVELERLRELLGRAEDDNSTSIPGQ